MKLFDTTIRDGSYYVDFKFSLEDVTEIVDRVHRLGFKHIEIGHGQGLNASSVENGLSLHSDEEYINAAKKTCGESKIGFFCIPAFANISDIKLLADKEVDFIRIGENADDILNVKEYVIKAKELGLEVFVNFMKSYIISPNQFVEYAKEIKNYGADCVYIVDSSGGMLPEKLKEYIDAIKEHVDIKIGFHGHNNLGMALENSLTVIRSGVDYVDTTMQGIGRSMGNTVAELLIMALEKYGYDTGFDIPQVLEYGYYINKNIIQGPTVHPLDYICGYCDFHSSNLKHIYRCCAEIQVDPLRLIMAYSAENKKNIDYDRLREIAVNMKVDIDNNPYGFRRYFSTSYNR